LEPTPWSFDDELERRPRLVSVLAAERLALLTRAAKPAKPFEEEFDFDLLATFAKATSLTRAGELRQDRLCTK
jgi:hypothetical protein